MSTVISVENLGKKYRLSHQFQKQPYVALRDVIAERSAAIGRGLLRPFSRLISSDPCPQPQVPASEDFWALKDVSFEIKQGDRVGIIGRNGAGKSTLLKILSRIVEPTTGKVRIKGRVASLLEVGTGFHPELTGRENIFLNGAILGMTRTEIRKKFDEIVDFAEIERFLDTPVKRYSSGMYVRLAFAVAAHLEPEILLVDEVLAVGDAQFQKKCLGKMEDVSAREGRTVLFVSHNMGAVAKLCSQAIWLRSGALLAKDNSFLIIQQYLSESFCHDSIREFKENPKKIAQILSVRITDDFESEKTEFDRISEPTIEIEVVFREKVKGCHIACILTTADGYHVYSTADADMNCELLYKARYGKYVTRVKLPTKLLNVGAYHLAVGVGVQGGEIFDRQEAISFTIHDTGDFGTLKEGQRRAGLLVVEQPWTLVRQG